MKLYGSKPVFNMEDFAKTTPAFGYSKKLNKIVFKNHEAFWMCVIASEQAGMMSDVPFDYDDSFLNFIAPINEAINAIKNSIEVKTNI